MADGVRLMLNGFEAGLTQVVLYIMSSPGGTFLYKSMYIIAQMNRLSYGTSAAHDCYLTLAFLKLWMEKEVETDHL